MKVFILIFSLALLNFTSAMEWPGRGFRRRRPSDGSSSSRPPNRSAEGSSGPMLRPGFLNTQPSGESSRAPAASGPMLHPGFLNTQPSGESSRAPAASGSTLRRGFLNYPPSGESTSPPAPFGEGSEGAGVPFCHQTNPDHGQNLIVIKVSNNLILTGNLYPFREDPSLDGQHGYVTVDFGDYKSIAVLKPRDKFNRQENIINNEVSAAKALSCAIIRANHEKALETLLLPMSFTDEDKEIPRVTFTSAEHCINFVGVLEPIDKLLPQWIDLQMFGP